MHVYNEIFQFNLIWGFDFEHNLRYPKITRDIMVYAGFRDARLDIPNPPPAQLAPTCTLCTMKKTWMPDLIRRKWSKPSTNACSDWRSKRRRALRTWPPYCHTCPSLHKGQLAPCLWPRLRRLVFSQHLTKIRPICHPVRVAPVPTRSGP